MDSNQVSEILLAPRHWLRFETEPKLHDSPDSPAWSKCASRCPDGVMTITPCETSTRSSKALPAFMKRESPSPGDIDCTLNGQKRHVMSVARL